MQQEIIENFYEKLVLQARHPWFFTTAEVPDTLDGRFETISLHTIAILYRFRSVASSAPLFKEVRDFGQGLYDHMFADFDTCLREMGVGDLGVSRRIKQMVQGVHGRIYSYAKAFDTDQGLWQILQRNVYGTVKVSEKAIRYLESYTTTMVDILRETSNADIVNGKVQWPHCESILPAKDHDFIKVVCG